MALPHFASLLASAPTAALSEASGPTGILWFYVAFIAMVLVFLALDLGVFHRNAHVVSAKEAATWSLVWASCALLFTIFVYYGYENHWLGLGQNVPVVGKPGETITLSGRAAAEQYLTGYIIEWSLSVDNLFVIAVIFSYFAVPAIYQHRVLFWGIMGALVMRGAMIYVGKELIERYSWVTYLFGGFLILTAIKMAMSGEQSVHPDKTFLVRTVRKLIPVTSHYDGQKFLTRAPDKAGISRLHATPLLLALIVVEFTDLIFAVDSVPAIFGITGDPFIVLTSNVFAIMGLRSLYFLLAKMLGTFRYLKPALVLILLFVGTKMLLVHTQYKVDTTVSLMVVVGLLGAGVAASLLIPHKDSPADDPEVSPEDRAKQE